MTSMNPLTRVLIQRRMMERKTRMLYQFLIRNLLNDLNESTYSRPEADANGEAVGQTRSVFL